MTTVGLRHASIVLALVAGLSWLNPTRAVVVNDLSVIFSITEADVAPNSIVIGRWAPFFIDATLSEGSFESVDEVLTGPAMAGGWEIESTLIIDQGRTLRLRIAHPDNPGFTAMIPESQRLGSGVVAQIPAGAISLSDDSGAEPVLTYQFESAVNSGLVLSSEIGVTIGTGPFALQTGWWWNPDESGRGFFIERQGDSLFLAGYLYSEDGRATWVVANGPLISDSEFDGALLSFRDGQTLSGEYQAPTQDASPGSIGIVFSSGSEATLAWPGGTVPIQRFDFNRTDGAGGGVSPEDGWWWNSEESGRGISIEIQNGILFMVAYLYDELGNPIWLSTQGEMQEGTFQGSWIEFANGQTLTGPYVEPQVIDDSVGNVRLEFTSPSTATLFIFEEQSIDIERFEF